MAGRVPSIQGRQYTNRKDLQNSPKRKPAPAAPAGGVGIPGAAQREIAAQVTPQAQPVQGPDPDTYALESVPNISDPSGRPSEALTAGLGQRSQISPSDQRLLTRLQGAYRADPSPQLADLIARVYTRADRSAWDWDTGWSTPGGDRAWGVF